MGCLLSSADTVVSPGDVQRFLMDKTRCDLAPCAFVNLLHGRAGNVHLRGTPLVGLLLQVNQPNDLVLVQRQQDRLDLLAPVGAEGINLWRATNPTAPWRSWQGRFPLFVFGIYQLYNVIRELSIRSERFTTLEFEGHSPVGVDGHCIYNGQPKLFVKLGEGIQFLRLVAGELLVAVCGHSCVSCDPPFLYSHPGKVCQRIDGRRNDCDRPCCCSAYTLSLHACSARCRACFFISGVQLSALERSFHRLAISEPSSMQYTTPLFFSVTITVVQKAAILAKSTKPRHTITLQRGSLMCRNRRKALYQAVLGYRKIPP